MNKYEFKNKTVVKYGGLVHYKESDTRLPVKQLLDIAEAAKATEILIYKDGVLVEKKWKCLAGHWVTQKVVHG